MRISERMFFTARFARDAGCAERKLCVLRACAVSIVLSKALLWPSVPSLFYFFSGLQGKFSYARWKKVTSYHLSLLLFLEPSDDLLHVDFRIHQAGDQHRLASLLAFPQIRGLASVPNAGTVGNLRPNSSEVPD